MRRLKRKLSVSIILFICGLPVVAMAMTTSGVAIANASLEAVAVADCSINAPDGMLAQDSDPTKVYHIANLTVKCPAAAKMLIGIKGSEDIKGLGYSYAAMWKDEEGKKLVVTLDYESVGCRIDTDSAVVCDGESVVIPVILDAWSRRDIMPGIYTMRFRASNYY